MEISDRSGAEARRFRLFTRFGRGSVGVEKFFRGTGRGGASSDGAVPVGRPAAADEQLTVPYTVPHRAHRGA